MCRCISKVGSLLFLAVFFAFSAHAESLRQCRINEIILTPKLQGLLPPSDISDVKVKDANEDFSRLQILDLLKSSGAKGACPSVNMFCRKLTRLMKKNSNMQFRKVHRNFCEENVTVSVNKSSTDKYIDLQWGLSQISSIDIGAKSAWDLTTGKETIVVAIVDSGTDTSHPDLKSNLWVNKHEIPGNNKDDDKNGFVDDIYGISAVPSLPSLADQNGHGTHVAGIIGAVGNNSRGVSGVNWKIKMMTVRALDKDGSGDLVDILTGYRYIINQKKRGVNLVAVNNSWGASGTSPSLAALMKSAQNLKIISVAAAGNEAENNDQVHVFPANINLPGVISVASINSQGNLSYFSNYGRSVDIAAPGEQIASTYKGGKYVYMSGTSMATPFVTGAIALVASRYGNLSVANMRSRIIDKGTSLPTLKGVIGSGKMLNLAKSVRN